MFVNNMFIQSFLREIKIFLFIFAQWTVKSFLAFFVCTKYVTFQLSFEIKYFFTIWANKWIFIYVFASLSLENFLNFKIFIWGNIWWCIFNVFLTISHNHSVVTNPMFIFPIFSTVSHTQSEVTNLMFIFRIFSIIFARAIYGDQPYVRFCNRYRVLSIWAMCSQHVSHSERLDGVSATCMTFWAPRSHFVDKCCILSPQVTFLWHVSHSEHPDGVFSTRVAFWSLGSVSSTCIAF